jgi:hypothetical protein
MPTTSAGYQGASLSLSAFSAATLSTKIEARPNNTAAEVAQATVCCALDVPTAMTGCVIDVKAASYFERNPSEVGMHPASDGNRINRQLFKIQHLHRR